MGLVKLCTLIDVGGVFTPKKVGCTVTSQQGRQKIVSDRQD